MTFILGKKKIIPLCWFGKELYIKIRTFLN